MSSPLLPSLPILPGPDLPSWLKGLLHGTHDGHHCSTNTPLPTMVVGQAMAPSFCSGPGDGLDLRMPSSIFMRVLSGAGLGWAGGEPGPALAQDALEAAPCSARGGFWGISHAYPSYGTGERWQFKQPPQPCELALCGTILVQLTARNPSDLWLQAPVIAAVLWYLAGVAEQANRWAGTCQRPSCARQRACDELQSSGSPACQVHL